MSISANEICPQCGHCETEHTRRHGCLVFQVLDAGLRHCECKLSRSEAKALAILKDVGHERDTLRAECERLRTALRGLVRESITHCYVVGCDAPATRVGGSGNALRCDDHGAIYRELPDAPAIRAALAALGKS